MGIGALEKRKWFMRVILMTILVVSGYSLWQYNTNPRFQREQWRQAVQFVEETRVSGSTVVFVFPDAFAPWQWYSRGIVPALSVAPRFVAQDSQLEQYRAILMEMNKIFYFHYLTELTDPQKSVPKFIEKLGFYATSTRDFPGVGFITVYEKALAFH
jgi:hypothetical protein